MAIQNQYGNQLGLSGNFGIIVVNGVTVGAFKAWTLNYGTNVTPEGQVGSSEPILFPGMNTVTVTLSRLVVYNQAFQSAGIDPAIVGGTLAYLGQIPPFLTQLYDQLSGTLVRQARNCQFDSASLNMPANAAATETLQLIGTDVAGALA